MIEKVEKERAMVKYQRPLQSCSNHYEEGYTFIYETYNKYEKHF